MPAKDYNNYMREYMKKRYERRRQEAIEYLGGACEFCGSDSDLEFDHIDPSSKVGTIARMGAGASKAKFWAEVDKCQLLCSECHKDKTASELEFVQKTYLFRCPECREEFERSHRQAYSWVNGEQNLKFCSHSCSGKYYAAWKAEDEHFSREDNLVEIKGR